MAKCRECKQTYQHKASCSRRKSQSRVYVDSVDELASSWPAGFSFDSSVSSCGDTGTSSPYGDSGGSSSSCGE